jgi:hypothetical protein
MVKKGKKSFSLLCEVINNSLLSRACAKHCPQLLSEQSYSTFWNIADLQHLASAIAYSDPLPPNIIWKEDMTELTYKSTRVNLTQLRKGLHTINDKILHLLTKLSGGQLLPCIIPTNLDDDLTKDEAGHSFLNHPSLSHQQCSIVEQLIKDPTLNFISNDHINHLHFSHGTMTMILTICAQINQMLMVLLHITSSQPPRGTEEIDIRLWNGHRHRNIFLVFGQIWKIIEATKTENTIGHSAFIPAVLPSEIAQHLFYYLVHVRPLEIFLSAKVYGSSTKVLYQEFLYVQLGKQVTSDQFSHSMSQLMAAHCGAAIGIRAWRHLAIALKREFIPPSMIDPFQTHQDVSDLAASHSTWTARKTYAIDRNSLPLLSTDAMLEHEAFCKHWHSVLHFGTSSPPAPLRQLQVGQYQQSRSNPNISEADISLKAMKDIVSDIQKDMTGQSQNVVSMFNNLNQQVQSLKTMLVDALHPSPNSMPVEQASTAQPVIKTNHQPIESDNDELAYLDPPVSALNIVI